MLPQGRSTGNGARLYFGNRALVLIVLRMEAAVWKAWDCSPCLAGTSWMQWHALRWIDSYRTR